MYGLAAEIPVACCSVDYDYRGCSVVSQSETWLNPCQSSGQLRYERIGGRKIRPVRHVLSRVSDRQKFYAPIEW